MEPALELPEVLRGIRAVSADVTRALAADVDRDARWPEESLRALQETRLTGLNVPRSAGGLGHGLLALVQACEILGRDCPSTALCFGMHCVGAAVIAAKATDDQCKRYLEPIARGEHLTTLALSEPGTGVHFYFPQARLVPDGPDAWRVNGTKTFVTNGGWADSYVVSTVAADPGASPHRFSCVMVPKDSHGIAWGAHWDGVGMRGNSSRDLKLRDVRVDRKDLLGKPGDQLWYVFQVITPFFLAAMTGTYLGQATTGLEEARSHLAKRSYSHSGSSPAHSPVMQHRLGTMWAQVERTRRLAYHAGVAGDRGDESALELLFAAKAEVADCAVSVVNDAMTMTGGISYRKGGCLERCLRDVRAVHVMSPTTDLLRTWTGRALLGLPILGD